MNPGYADAIEAARESIMLTEDIVKVHDYAIVLIAGIISDLYGVETKRVMRDLTEKRRR